eukprot:COSAG05_NODE_744_length_7586_cov_230.209964_4_plen_188_part_01
MSRFEQALEQVRRAHQEDLNELPDDLHEALELQTRVQQHVARQRELKLLMERKKVASKALWRLSPLRTIQMSYSCKVHAQKSQRPVGWLSLLRSMRKKKTLTRSMCMTEIGSIVLYILTNTLQRERNPSQPAIQPIMRSARTGSTRLRPYMHVTNARLYGFAYNSGSSRGSYDIMTGIGSRHMPVYRF